MYAKKERKGNVRILAIRNKCDTIKGVVAGAILFEPQIKKKTG